MSSSEDEFEGFNSEKVSIEWYIDTGYVGPGRWGNTWVFLPGELPTDPTEREDLLEEMINTELNNHIVYGWRDPEE